MPEGILAFGVVGTIAAALLAASVWLALDGGGTTVDSATKTGVPVAVVLVLAAAGG